MLAVDLDQRGADRLERLHAHRLIVDEGTGAAVAILDAAQDHLTIGIQAVGGEDPCGRMLLADLEHGRHLALLGAVANQTGIAATAKGQRKSIKQDRLAGAGLAGQHRKPIGKLEIESFDQDDVTDRQSRQHGGSSPS